jgi:hypothetical protein
MCARRGCDLRGCDVRELGCQSGCLVLDSSLSVLVWSHLENGQTGLLSTSERELLFPCAGVCVMKVKVILPLSRSLSLAER